MSSTPERAGGCEIAVLASRVGAAEKRLFDAFDRRGVRFEHVDTRREWFVAGGGGVSRGVVLNREIGPVRAVYAARCWSVAGADVVNSADATEVCVTSGVRRGCWRRRGFPCRVPRWV